MFWWVCPTVCIVALKLATKVTARTSDLCVDWEMNFNWVTDPAICGWTARKHFCIYDTPLSNDLVSVYTVSTKKLACQLLWPHVLFSRTCAHLPISPLTSLCGLCTESPVGQNSNVGWFRIICLVAPTHRHTQPHPIRPSSESLFLCVFPYFIFLIQPVGSDCRDLIPYILNLSVCCVCYAYLCLTITHCPTNCCVHFVDVCDVLKRREW